MSAETRSYRYRITLDRNTLMIDRICAAQGADLQDPADAVVEELDGHAGLLHAIVSWLRPRSVFTDNLCVGESARLERACGRMGIRVIHAPLRLPQGKGRVERMAARRARGVQ